MQDNELFTAEERTALIDVLKRVTNYVVGPIDSKESDQNPWAGAVADELCCE